MNIIFLLLHKLRKVNKVMTFAFCSQNLKKINSKLVIHSNYLAQLSKVVALK